MTPSPLHPQLLAVSRLDSRRVGLRSFLQLPGRGLDARRQLAEREQGVRTVQPSAKLDDEIHDTGVTHPPAIALSGAHHGAVDEAINLAEVSLGSYAMPRIQRGNI